MTDTLFELAAPAPAVHKEARLSTDGVYRYTLHRTWSSGDPDGSECRVTWIMLNPSTADHRDDDNTIVRCTGFARSWGYDGFDVVNLYAYRATKPKDMFAAAAAGVDIVGPKNDEVLRTALAYAAARREPVIAAWGANARPDRVAQLLEMPHADQLQCLTVTARTGQPGHPLMLPSILEPRPWAPAAKETP